MEEKKVAIAEKKIRREDKKEARLRELNPPKRRRRVNSSQLDGGGSDSRIVDSALKSRIEVVGISKSFDNYPDPQLSSAQPFPRPYFANGLANDDDVGGQNKLKHRQ